MSRGALQQKSEQTIGIFGGIVIGQASVEAALTKYQFNYAVACIRPCIFHNTDCKDVVLTPVVTLSAYSLSRCIRRGLGLAVGLYYFIAHFN